MEEGGKGGERFIQMAMILAPVSMVANSTVCLLCIRQIIVTVWQNKSEEGGRKG